MDDMTMTLNVFDYVTPEQLAEAALDEVKRSIREQIKKESDVERVLSNFTSEFVFQLICDEWKKHDKDFEAELRKGIQDAIKSSVSWYVFRRKDVWDRTESPAVAILDDECRNSRPLIREMVEKHIREYPFHELDRDEIGGMIYDVIMEKILKPKDGKDAEKD